MTKGLVTIDRKAARAIAEELFALMSEEMGKIKPADIVPDEYFNVKQAAEFLGWSVHTVRHKKRRDSTFQSRRLAPILAKRPC